MEKHRAKKRILLPAKEKNGRLISGTLMMFRPIRKSLLRTSIIEVKIYLLALQPQFLIDFYTFWSLDICKECCLLRKESQMKKDIIAAHEYCTNNKESLQRDSVCGCFYCLKIFSPPKITEWIKETEGTALFLIAVLIP